MSNPSKEAVKRIIVADDDPNIASLISMECEDDGYSVDVVSDGQQAIEKLREETFDLAILDWDMPLMTGYDVCKRLRDKGSRLPVLMVTAKDDIDDRIKALDAGADDYLCKPFNVRELLARVRALVRRSSFLDEKANNLQYDCLSLVVDEHRFAVNGKDIHLTVREFSLMEALLESPKQVISRDRLLEQVWGADYFGDVTVVDTYIKYLRAKLAKEGVGEMIKTVRGVGFTLRDS